MYVYDNTAPCGHWAVPPSWSWESTLFAPRALYQEALRLPIKLMTFEFVRYVAMYTPALDNSDVGETI